MAVKYDCTACRKQVTATKNNRYRSHTDGNGEPCEMSSVEIPEHVLAQPVGKDDAPDVPREGIDYAVCPQCGRKVKLTRLGYFEPHETTLKGGERCPVSGVRHKHARRTEDVPLPGDGKPKPGAEIPAVKDSARPVANRGLALEASPASTGSSATMPTVDAPTTEPMLYDGPDEDAQWSEYMNSLESTATSKGLKNEPSGVAASPGSRTTSSDAGEGDADAGPFHLAPLLGDGTVLQPFSHISQPFPVPVKVKLKEAMSEDGKLAAARFKEVFFAYNNRQSSDNRSAQTTLGPSEIGHECDRRLAMSLMGVPATNPGGDGWRAWIGTQGHRGLEEIFTRASGRSGRFITETRVSFDSELVPYGTADLFDRVHGEVGDFKFLGRYSLDKLVQQGPPPHYRVQLHTYGLGMERLGEKVRQVTLYGLPGEGKSLDEMYVWTAPYDRRVALEAIARVERIAARVQGMPLRKAGPMAVARTFDTADECRFCPFHLKGDKKMERGCPGK